ncbi:hypothetical protein [Streptomyces sp. NPDC001155]
MTDTATVLGPEWQVSGLLSSALLVHPLGFHCALDIHANTLQVSAFVTTSRNPARDVEAVTVTMPVEDADGEAVAEMLHNKVLPHFGRQDAIAALRLLSMPLRDAKIPAVAKGTTSRTEIELRLGDGGNPVITVVMTSPHDDSVQVGLLLDRLTLDQAIRCARAALHDQLPTVGPTRGRFAPDVDTVLDALPGLSASQSQAGPRFTIIRTPDDALKIRHDAHAIAPDAPLGLAIPETTVTTAYAVLRAYTVTE